MPKRLIRQVRERALRLFETHGGEYASQAEIDAGSRPGITSEESAEIKRLRAENRLLRDNVAVLRATTTFFAGELDPRNR